MYTHKRSHARASRRRCASTGGEILPAPKSTTKIPTDLGRASATIYARGGTSCKGWGTREHLLAAGLGDVSLSHASRAPKYGRGARARPRAETHAPEVAHRRVVTAFCGTSEPEQLRLLASYESIPRQGPCLPQETGRGLCLLVWFWLGDFFFVCLLPCLFVF